jgi:threonine dehydrogenase-like Zn-dependent dehydrogenase
VRITTTAICGTDLHLIRGTLSGMKPGTVLGHEAVGVVEDVGPDTRNLRPGDRVVVPSTIGCGYCTYCRAGYYAQCDNASLNGPGAGTVFFGGPESKNLTINAGNCNHRRYLPELIDIVTSGRMSLAPNVSHALAFEDVVDAYEAFDHRDEGWLKVALVTT